MVGALPSGGVEGVCPDNIHCAPPEASGASGAARSRPRDPGSGWSGVGRIRGRADRHQGSMGAPPHQRGRRSPGRSGANPYDRYPAAVDGRPVVSSSPRSPVDDPRRRTPRTDAVLGDPAITAAVERLGRLRVKTAVDAAIDACRRAEIAPDDVVATALAALPPSATSLRPVVNATGV